MKKHFLSNAFPRASFSPEAFQRIIDAFKPVQFKKGDFLLREGEVEQYYWFAETGLLRSFVIDPEGKDITTHFFGETDIVIDWVSFFHRRPTREHIQALSDCNCWEISFERFQELFHSIAAFREAGRDRFVAKFFELKQHSVSIIVDQAKDRYIHFLEHKPEIVEQAPLKHIASYLGITDTSLSRIRKEIAS
jgi:CRP-like cAMP-binding protein